MSTTSPAHRIVEGYCFDCNGGCLIGFGNPPDRCPVEGCEELPEDHYHPPVIDVQRLALALHEERSDRWGGCGNPGEAYDDHMTFHQTRAERIAVEYVRLLSPQEPPAQGEPQR